VGAVEKWTNPESGNSGTSTLVEKSESDGVPCRRVRHDLSVKGFADPRSIEALQVSKREWKIES
jgi:hypothetical protein